MLKKLFALGILTVMAVLLFIFSPFDAAKTDDGNPEVQRRGEVIKIIKDSDTLQTLEVLMDNDQTVTIENDESMAVSPRKFKEGDEVILLRSQAGDGSYIY